MKLLIIDNFDSFTYNLVQIVEELAIADYSIETHDKVDIDMVSKFGKILLTPGPGLPNEHPILEKVIRKYCSSKSIIGVCLGHQAIGEAFGGTLTNLSDVYHGVATNCNVLNTTAPLFEGLGNNLEIGRYHSWVIAKENFPESLEITAEDDNGFIMGLQHKTFDVQGVQFHPESVLTPQGEAIMRNWLKH